MHPDRKAQRSLARALAATRATVDVVADLDAAIAAADADAVIVVDQALARERRVPPAVGRWIAVPGDGSAPADPALTGALIEAGWRHVCAHPMPVLVEELLATVQKLRRADVFGLDKYMAWGAEARSVVLDDAADRDTAVAQLARDIIGAGLPDRIGSLVSVIADELVANALYTAPIDADGARFRRDEPRDRPRPLAGKDAVALRWATDGRYLAIAVRDAWGSLDPAAVGARLARGGVTPELLADGSRPLEPAPPGMGLALVYACCNQLVINLVPGATTEVIALIDVRYRPTELAKAASFHAFVAAAGAGAGAGP